jgi:hypothetical protein
MSQPKTPSQYLQQLTESVWTNLGTVHRIALQESSPLLLLTRLRLAVGADAGS